MNTRDETAPIPRGRGRAGGPPGAGRRAGFSLVELLAASAIAVLVIGAAALLVTHTVRGTRAIEESLDLVVRARAAMEWIARDLATARFGPMEFREPAGPSSQSVRWSGDRTNAGKVTAAFFEYAYAAGMPPRLVRTADGGAAEEILSNVRRFRVEPLDGATGRFQEIHAQSIWLEPPSALRITLTIADALGRRERTVRRVVYLGERGSP